MSQITITYASRKQERYDKAFKPCVWMNGKAVYHTERCAKTFNGGLKKAKSVANKLANYYKANTKNVVIISEIK